MTVHDIYEKLYTTYGPMGWWPLLKESHNNICCDYSPCNTTNPKTPSVQFEICSGTILTQTQHGKMLKLYLYN